MSIRSLRFIVFGLIACSLATPVFKAQAASNCDGYLVNPEPAKNVFFKYLHVLKGVKPKVWMIPDLKGILAEKQLTDDLSVLQFATFSEGMARVRFEQQREQFLIPFKDQIKAIEWEMENPPHPDQTWKIVPYKPYVVNEGEPTFGDLISTSQSVKKDNGNFAFGFRDYIVIFAEKQPMVSTVDEATQPGNIYWRVIAYQLPSAIREAKVRGLKARRDYFDIAAKSTEALGVIFAEDMKKIFER